MHMTSIRFVSEIDCLVNQYISLIEESSRLQEKNPKEAMVILTQASSLEVKIEELKIAYKN